MATTSTVIVTRENWSVEYYILPNEPNGPTWKNSSYHGEWSDAVRACNLLAKKGRRARIAVHKVVYEVEPY